MGSMIVAGQPIGRHVTHFLQAIEDVAVEHIGEVGLVESLDLGALGGLARLSVLQGDPPLALPLMGPRVGDELLLPRVERGLRDPDLATDLLNRGAGVNLVQRKRDLFLSELALLHGELSFVEFAGIL